MKRCGKEHQTITFCGKVCPLCFALGYLEDALEALDNIGRVLNCKPVKSQPRHRAKLFVVPKRGA
jgi:hypothetical protein